MTAPRKSLEPWIKDEVNYYEHQIQGIRLLARKRSFILGDDMGLGKSLQALTVFAVDVARDWAKTAIIICPLSLKENWANEIETYSRFPYTLLAGTPAQRRTQIAEFATRTEPRILIVNYEQVSPHLEELNALKFDVAIFDEAHYLKNPKAVRTQACLSLRSRRSFMLTGTPMLNHVNELWSLFHRIDPARWPRYWSFVNRYVVFGGYKDKQIVGVKNEKELRGHLQNVMLRRLKDEVLDLPEVQFIQRIVPLSKEQRLLYDEVLGEMRLPRADSLEPEEIENHLTKFLRLKQICGTTFPFTGIDHSSKLDLAVEDDYELLENGKRVVVFTQFRDVQACYSNRMRKYGVPIFELSGDVPPADRQRVVNQWAATEQSVIVCMLQVAGVGLNMVAAQNASFLDKLFVPGLNRQAVDRLHRIGQDKSQPVMVREYICKGTIESRIEAILKMKKNIFGTVVETDPNWMRKLYRALLDEEG